MPGVCPRCRLYSHRDTKGSEPPGETAGYEGWNLLQAKEATKEWEIVTKPEENGEMSKNGERGNGVTEWEMPQKLNEGKPETERKEKWQWLEKPLEHDASSTSRSQAEELRA